MELGIRLGVGGGLEEAVANVLSLGHGLAVQSALQLTRVLVRKHGRTHTSTGGAHLGNRTGYKRERERSKPYEFPERPSLLYTIDTYS